MYICHTHIYPPTLSASSVLNILCHLTSTYHHLHVGSKAAREQGRQCSKGNQGREQGTKAGDVARKAKAARQQYSKTTDPWI